MNCRLLLVALGICLGALTSQVLAGDEPYQWLERMSAAMNQLDYQGTFVYVRGEDVETMRITHVVDENGVQERLVSVSGSPREVVRDSSGVRWIAGGEDVVLPNSANSRMFFPELPPGDPAAASESYQFTLRGQQRIAGHTGRKLDIVPRDPFRYGYRLWIEPRSGLLLKWELTGEEGESLAKLMFTELKTGTEVDPTELRSTGRPENSRTQPAGISPPSHVSRGGAAWLARQLPPGFRLASHRQQPLSANTYFEHLVYSDGIAAVSVYIEPAQQNPTLALGQSQIGTTHAYSQLLESQLITALGDVPAVTVKIIGESVGPANP